MMKWALVTGASSGIGLATAQNLAQANYSLILVARRLDRLELIKSEIERKFAVQVQIAQLDVRSLEQIQQFIEKHRELLAQVSVLINCAGLAKGANKVKNANIAHWEQMISTNINGLIYMTRLMLAFMLNQAQGHIVNIGSVAGLYTYTGGSVYCGTKFFVRAFSEALRQDLLGTQIRVTNIEPGMVNTEFSLVRLDDQTKADQVYQGMTPLTAQDIADTISWCIGRPSHVNIQELVIFPTDQAAVGMVHRKA
jgi:NADP-dependent 3-hydroxy acid dehydrogenase YdfG